MESDSQGKAPPASDAKPITFSLSFLTKIFNAISDPIFVKDKNHRWIFANEAFSKILGRPIHEYLYKSDYDLFPKELADVFWAKDNEIFNFGIPNENEEKILLRDGSERTIITKKTPIQTDEGVLLVGIIRDVTHEKEAQGKMLYAARMTTFGEIAAGLAHDLNNPMAIILGRAQQLKEFAATHSLGALIDKAVKSIESCCNRSIQVIHELQKLGKPSADRCESSISLKNLLVSIHNLFRPRLNALGIQFSFNLNANDIYAFGSEPEIRQVLITLTQGGLNLLHQQPIRKIHWDASIKKQKVNLRLIFSNNTFSSNHLSTKSLYTSTALNPQYTVGLNLVESILVANSGKLNLPAPEDPWNFEIILPLPKSTQSNAA